MIKKQLKKLCTPVQRLKRKHGWLKPFLCWFENNIITTGKWIGIHHFVHRDKDRKILWEGWAYNDDGLANEGQKATLELFFRGENAPAGFEVGLFYDTVVKTDAPTDLQNEASGNGYARIALARNTTDFPTSELDGGDWAITSKIITFSATGGSWGPVNMVCHITTDATKRLISFADLAFSRTLEDGQTMDHSVKIKLTNKV